MKDVKELALGAWIRWHLARKHKLVAIPAKDRSVYSCSCGGTYLVTD